MDYEYREGRLAYFDGLSIWSNPYDMDDEWHDYEEWELGFLHASEESE